MNRLPTNVQWIKNTVGHSLELLHMNTNVQKRGQSFQFTISIFSIFGISFRDHPRRNYSINSYVLLRCCHTARLIQVQSPFCNARFHHSEGLRTALHQLTAQESEQMCLDAKIKLKYLPPYSSDCNTIDETFEELKA